MQPSKRRRLNNASHTLSQPFKSPFKSPLKTKTFTQTKAHVHLSSSATDDTDQKTLLSTRSSPPKPSPVLTTAPFRKPTPTSHAPASPELLALQKNHTRLLNHLSAARSRLETSHQALKIESSDRDTELEALIVKWRLASRAAAEDVFAGARDKVNKMGGVGAMRDRERQKKDMTWGWDNEPKKTDDEGDGDGEEAGEENDAKSRLEEEEIVEQDEGEEGARKGEDYGWDEECYTMNMMFKSLNIDLDIIGYDKRLQKWID